MGRKSITLRLTLLFGLVSTAALLLLGAFIAAAVESHFEEMDADEIHAKLELARHALAKVYAPTDLDALPQQLDDALIGHRNLSIAIVSPDGTLLFASRTPDFPHALLVGTAASALDRKPPLSLWEEGGRSYRATHAEAVTNLPGRPVARVAVSLGIAHHQHFMAQFERTLWLAVAIGIAVTAVLGWFAARRGLAPVRDLTALARGISAEHLEARLATAALPIELVELGAAFNDMLARLEDSFARLSEFSSDIAHELRTPISNLMMQTQVALSKARDADEYREILYSNLEEYDRLARMTAEMLFLAKADNGLIVAGQAPVDLGAEVRGLFDFYEALALENGVALALDGDGVAAGDALMLRRALSNLIANALRHTPRGGTVRVTVAARPTERVVVAVDNPGEPIAPEHLARLFDRFYRVDPARQKSGEGAGLGLAITKSIVEAHGGTIAASSADGHTRFELTLPRAA